MPKIQWQRLPPAVLSHLVERVRESARGTDDLKRLDDWKRTEPEAPDGQWHKDFGSFKVCGKRRASADCSHPRSEGVRHEAVDAMSGALTSET
jgi:hypothetical protein